MTCTGCLSTSGSSILVLNSLAPAPLEDSLFPFLCAGQLERPGVRVLPIEMGVPGGSREERNRDKGRREKTAHLDVKQPMRLCCKDHHSEEGMSSYS